MNKKTSKIHDQTFNNFCFYKDWKWWTYLIFLIISIGFLLVGIYYAMFVDYWYISKKWANAEWLNFEILTSFLSVQVNIITIGWFMLIVLNYQNPNFLKGKALRVLLNWNLLVFVIFWIGVLMDLIMQTKALSSYHSSQIWCTIVTHFICPLFLIVMYSIESGKTKINIRKTFKQQELYYGVAYPFAYLVYILLRAVIYDQTNLAHSLKTFLKWPYPFLDFDNPMIGNSYWGYFFMLITAFGCWLLVNHLIIVWWNNYLYKHKHLQRKKITS